MCAIVHHDDIPKSILFEIRNNQLKEDQSVKVRHIVMGAPLLQAKAMSLAYIISYKIVCKLQPKSDVTTYYYLASDDSSIVGGPLFV